MSKSNRLRTESPDMKESRSKIRSDTLRWVSRLKGQPPGSRAKEIIKTARNCQGPETRSREQVRIRWMTKEPKPAMEKPPVLTED